ncbi:MAG: VOC family protein [Tannerella sp.]|nr:VOC family protein [Tannerella sp.]
MKIAYSTMIVEDMKETVRFLTDIMGFEVDSTYAPHIGTNITLMKGRGETMLEIIEDKSFPVGLYSIGMKVEKLDEMVEIMRAEGVEIMTEITPTLVGRMAMIKDPNGIRYALIEPK